MDSGEELAVDLKNLWMVATDDLPELAARWAGASEELNGNSMDGATFERPATAPGVLAGGHQLKTVTVGRVYPHFDLLRDALRNIMAESTTNVYDAIDALIEIINNYADVDQIAKDRLERSVGSHIRKSGPPRPTVHGPFPLGT